MERLYSFIKPVETYLPGQVLSVVGVRFTDGGPPVLSLQSTRLTGAGLELQRVQPFAFQDNTGHQRTVRGFDAVDTLALLLRKNN